MDRHIYKLNSSSKRTSCLYSNWRVFPIFLSLYFFLTLCSFFFSLSLSLSLSCTSQFTHSSTHSYAHLYTQAQAPVIAFCGDGVADGRVEGGLLRRLQLHAGHLEASSLQSCPRGSRGNPNPNSKPDPKSVRNNICKVRLASIMFFGLNKDQITHKNVTN